MDTRKFILILTVVIAVYVTVSSATQAPVEEKDNKAVELATGDDTKASEKNGGDTHSSEVKPKSKPKRKHHKKNHNANSPSHNSRPRGSRRGNRTRAHKSHRHGPKDKSKQKNSTGTVDTSNAHHEETPRVKSNSGDNTKERSNRKEKKNRSRNREGRNRNHEREGSNHSSHHNIQNDGASNGQSGDAVYQTQNYNHNLVGHSTKTSVKHEPTKSTGSSK